MALSDCIKCWCTPCECGYKYREMSIENKINQIKAIVGEDKNKIMTKLNQMNEQFEQGELVKVRNNNTQEWDKRVYVGTMPNCEGHWVMKKDQDTETFDGYPVMYSQIRKIQKPEPDRNEIERPEQGTIEYLQEQINFLKNQLIDVVLKIDESRIENQRNGRTI